MTTMFENVIPLPVKEAPKVVFQIEMLATNYAKLAEVARAQGLSPEEYIALLLEH